MVRIEISQHVVLLLKDEFEVAFQLLVQPSVLHKSIDFL